ncbi:hypothetical protein GWK41_03570 [Persephonella atlantica]|uniref:GGDEF domain-containing protein n=1 Tax=Persephonella atlantica TaxID=2699429 RepID=A0ABS1GGU0_9AQUI|nr:hypothetical protein [Persephonella atlantica]MBK3332146.1 hypothetical protein [Persephonella atlantica]
MLSEEHIYDFEVFKALVELEIRRIERYRKESTFSIAFLYAPELATKIKENKESLKEVDVAFIIKDNLRAVDVISPVEEDFVFLFFPETEKKMAQRVIERLKKVLSDKNIIEGVASYPEDGKDKHTLFAKLVEIMNEKLVPVIELD